MVHGNNPDQTELLDPPPASDVETFEIVLELERELNMRRKVYPAMITKHRISKEQAARRIRIIETCLEDYKKRMAAETREQIPAPPE